MLLRTVDKLKRREHVTIVALGDSNTETTFHTHGRMNWVGLLSEAIFETYGNGVCTLINAGKCASTFRDALTRLDRDVLRFNPDLVIIALGMNDAGQLNEDISIQTFKQDVRTTVLRIRESCDSEILIRTPNPVVAVNGVPLPPGAVPGGVLATIQAKRCAAVLVELAEELGCPVVDHYRLWTEHEFPATLPVADPNRLWPRMSDAIHPGALGHLVFFRELAPLFDLPGRFPWEG